VRYCIVASLQFHQGSYLDKGSCTNLTLLKLPFTIQLKNPFNPTRELYVVLFDSIPR